MLNINLRRNHMIRKLFQKFKKPASYDGENHGKISFENPVLSGNPNISKKKNILFTGASGAGKTVSGCFSEIERAMKNKESIFVFSREREYDYMKDELMASGYIVTTICLEEYTWDHLIEDMLEIPENSEIAIFFENQLCFFDCTLPDKINQQFGRQLLSLLHLLWKENSKRSSVIIVDDITFYQFPNKFWDYFKNAEAKSIRFVFNAFTLFHLERYLSYTKVFDTPEKEAEYKFLNVEPLLLENCTVVHIGGMFGFDLSIIPQTYPCMKNFIDIYYKNLQDWTSRGLKYTALQLSLDMTEEDVINGIFYYKSNEEYQEYLQKYHPNKE